MNRRKAIKSITLSAGAISLSPYLKSAGFLLFDDLKKDAFGKDFLWGVATAAYQIEGAIYKDGKGLSIWDMFTHKPKAIYKDQNGDIACDFYHRYESDIQLVKKLGFDVFRFSIAWSRILPKGTGRVNQKGIEFYHKVIDTCIANGVQPWITLYHWDLPQALQEQGGWKNREIINWFSEYVNVCTKEYGNKVKNWMVLNEPLAFTALGYLLGVHAPGKIG
jgi:beta-glucosidase